MVTSYLVQDGYIYKKSLPKMDSVFTEDFQWKLWVPASLTLDVIEKAYCPTHAAHGGFHKTLKRVREYFCWPNMTVQIRDFVQQCGPCKESKPQCQNMIQPMGEEPRVEKAFQRIYIDFLGPYVRSKSGNALIFIVLDHLTKFVLLKAMVEANTKNVLKFLIDVVSHKFGVPEILISDNGKQFTSKDFADMCLTFGIYHMRTALYFPQSNASERVNQSQSAAILVYEGRPMGVGPSPVGNHPVTI